MRHYSEPFFLIGTSPEVAQSRDVSAAHLPAGN